VASILYVLTLSTLDTIF